MKTDKNQSLHNMDGDDSGSMGKDEPDWAHRARHIPHKPEWVDAIPRQLWPLGEVFFPIPRREKGHNYPHSLDDYRYGATDEILNAYLESGSGYGIACAGYLAVLDIDELEYVDCITSQLPESLYQVTGSREGIHVFYMCPGLDSRINLRVKLPQNHMVAEGYTDDVDLASRHIGEVKCDEHGYVVGPGSVHPSGNRYGPLKGDSITEISEDVLRDALAPFIVSTTSRTYTPEEKASWQGNSSDERYEFYNLSARDVLPWLSAGNRIAHPIHGSSTGSNFMLNDDGETFTCWRCNHGEGDGCGLSGPQFLALEACQNDNHMMTLDCDEVRDGWRTDNRLHYLSWRRAVDQELIDAGDVPYKVIQGYAQYRGVADDPDSLSGEAYWTVKNALMYEQDYWEM